MTTPNDLPSELLTDQQLIEKYKTLARAMVANDVRASRLIYGKLQEQNKTLSSDEVFALGLRWIGGKKGHDKAMVPFLKELGFDFTRSIILSEEERDGTAIPFRLLGDEEDRSLLLTLLEEKCIEPDIMDGVGDSLLVAALENEAYDFAYTLINKGVDINAINLMGQTALHTFAGKLDFRAVNWLCENKINPEIEDFQQARASEVVPTEMEGWDANSMYEALEEYVVQYRSLLPFMPPEEFRQMLQKEIQENAPEDPNGNDPYLTTGDQAAQAQAIAAGLGIGTGSSSGPSI